MYEIKVSDANDMRDDILIKVIRLKELGIDSNNSLSQHYL
jgi:hypothetical protein